MSGEGQRRGAAAAAGLPAWLTLDACRRSGLTELADAGLTEEQEMSMSGHTTPNAKRRYVARTEIQRFETARKRRANLATRGERNGAETRNEAENETRNGATGKATMP